MKRLFRINKRVAVAGLATGLIMAAGGVAVAFFTSNGTGSGTVYTGTGANLTISQLAPNSQVVYNSIVDPQNPDTWGLSFGGTNATAFGNSINLASTSSILKNVIVSFVSEACQTGAGLTCVTTPGATFVSNPITLTLYDPSNNMAVIGFVTNSFTMPYRPSAAGASDPHCGATSGLNWANYPNTGSQWYDPITNNCYYGIKYAATFDFTSANLTLPTNVVYGISYNATSGPTSSLNVEMSNEATDVTVGSNANPGNVFVAAGSLTNALGGPNGQVTCSSVGTSFASYSTAPGNANNCGLQVPQNNTIVADNPQVQFSIGAANSIGLVPGGPGQPIDFSIHNNGSGPAHVQSVQFALGTLPSGCAGSWFNKIQPLVPINVTIPGGATVSYQPSGAMLALLESNTNQDACAGQALPITFTSN